MGTMPEFWLPWHTFLATFVASALMGVSMIIKPEGPPSWWELLRAFLFYGGLGCGFGMTGFHWLGGKEHPERVIGCGFLVGLRIIQYGKIREFVRKVLDGKNPPVE